MGDAETMSVREAAEALGVDPSTVYKLIRAGKLAADEKKFIRRNRFRVRRESVDRLLRGD